MKFEWWKRGRGRIWHACIDNPSHDALSTEPDIYSMISLCERHEFQRDGTKYRPWTKIERPSHVCKACDLRLGDYCR